MVWVSVILAASVPIVLVGGICNRLKTDKGIGWQFIRFAVLATSIPVVGLLALNGALTGEAATIIGAAMAYVFGKASETSPSKVRGNKDRKVQSDSNAM